MACYNLMPAFVRLPKNLSPFGWYRMILNGIFDRAFEEHVFFSASYVILYEFYDRLCI
jgi:hypothetical protein